MDNTPAETGMSGMSAVVKAPPLDALQAEDNTYLLAESGDHLNIE